MRGCDVERKGVRSFGRSAVDAGGNGYVCEGVWMYQECQLSVVSASVDSHGVMSSHRSRVSQQQAVFVTAAICPAGYWARIAAMHVYQYRALVPTQRRYVTVRRVR